MSQPSALPATDTGGETTAVKIVVDQEGMVRVTGQELQAVGFELESADQEELSLTVAGEPVGFTVTDIGGDPAIVFFGLPRESRYGRENVYWLMRSADGTRHAAVPSERAVGPGQGEPIGSFEAQVVLEEDAQYLSQTAEDTDHWLWQSMLAPDSFGLSFDLPAWAGGDLTLRTTVWASTQDARNPDHHVVLQINGQELVQERWDGKGWHTLSTPVAAGQVRPEGNELVIQVPGDTGAVVDGIYLDQIEITYSRRIIADQGRLEFTAPGGAQVVVQGLNFEEVFLWDVSEPSEPVALSGFTTEAGTLIFQDDQAMDVRRYAAYAPTALRRPLAIIPVSGSDLRHNPEGADYIVVTHPDFTDALRPLVDLRSSQGLRVTVANIEDVYDTFSNGMLDPSAIREYMRHARDHWPPPAPRFLLLVGDATYDYQGVLKGGTPNFVPTYLLATRFVGETASDNWFVRLDDVDDRPDMAVGRIPAQRPHQVAAVVAKTLAYENSDSTSEWQDRALFVADNKQTEFQSMSEDLASKFLPGGYQVERIYLGQTADAGEEVVNSLREGVGLVTYIGHGSMNVWAQEKIFQIEDINNLDNGSALPFMMTMTCLVGYFHHPTANSMGEELLFKPDGGVVAALVPTSESLATDQRYLAEGMYSHLFGDAPTIGEAIMLAKQDLPSERDIMQDLVETFVLLGDPALRLRTPASSR